MVTMLKYTLAYLKAANRIGLKSPHHEKKPRETKQGHAVAMVGGGHFSTYTDVKSFSCVPGTNTV